MTRLIDSVLRWLCRIGWHGEVVEDGGEYWTDIRCPRCGRMERRHALE